MDNSHNLVERILLVVCALMVHVSVFAQNLLNKQTNVIQADSIVKNSINYFDSGGDGESQLWDFSSICHSKGKYIIVNSNKSPNIISSEESDRINYYLVKDDSLFLCAHESRLQKIRYDSPILEMQYPFAYADSISKPFVGYGVYCGNHHFKESGMITLQGDAYGSIILSEKDTIPNVLKVHTLKSYSLAMDMHPEALDTAKLKQVIEERYQWFARGYRYPIFETITSTSYADLNALGTTYQAYCYLPEDQMSLNDSVNMEIQKRDLEDKVHQDVKEKDIFHYDIQVSGNIINVNYQLDENARVSSIVSSPMGIVYKQKKWNGTAGETSMETIDCSGLIRGQYVLYMNVNGKVYSEKVTIK